MFTCPEAFKQIRTNLKIAIDECLFEDDMLLQDQDDEEVAQAIYAKLGIAHFMQMAEVEDLQRQEKREDSKGLSTQDDSQGVDVHDYLRDFRILDTQGELCIDPVHEQKISNMDIPKFEDLDEQRTNLKIAIDECLFEDDMLLQDQDDEEVAQAIYAKLGIAHFMQMAEVEDLQRQEKREDSKGLSTQDDSQGVDVHDYLRDFRILDTQGELCIDPVHEQKISNMDIPKFEDLDEQSWSKFKDAVIQERWYEDDEDFDQMFTCPEAFKQIRTNLKIAIDECLFEDDMLLQDQDDEEVAQAIYAKLGIAHFMQMAEVEDLQRQEKREDSKGLSTQDDSQGVDVHDYLRDFRILDTQGELCIDPVHEQKISNMDIPKFEDLDEQRSTLLKYTVSTTKSCIVDDLERPSANCFAKWLALELVDGSITCRQALMGPALEFADKSYGMSASSNANNITIRLVDGCF
ncbi:hypothetical protein L7F22_001866 [Adiantum nelumboides]|nr:hypothetical protein [Adiantum nelumboides]